MANILNIMAYPATYYCMGVVLLLLAGFAVFRWYRYTKLYRPHSFIVRWLTSEQKNALTHAAIPFTVTTVHPGEDALLFTRSNFKRALKALKARAVATYESDADRTLEAVLTFGLPKDRVLKAFKATVDDSQNRGWYRRWYYKWRHGRKIASIVRDVLLPSVKKNMVVHLSRGSAHRPIDDGIFHVFLHSTPHITSAAKPPTSLLGINIGRREESYCASGSGIPIIDERTDFALAELVDNCLYVHLDVTGYYWNSRPEFGLLVRVLQKVDEELVADKFLADIVKEANAKHPPLPARAGDASHSVSTEGFRGRIETVVSSLVRDILLPAVGKDVIVKNCGGGNQPPVHDGNFRVFFHASPLGAASMETPERVWGYRLLRRGPAFAPSAAGLPIIDDGGFIVGELVDNNLYLHQQYIHYGSKIEAALVARLLLEVRKELAEAGAATPETLSRKLAEHFKDECRRQMQSCAARGLNASAQEVAKARKDLAALIKGTRLAEFDLLRMQAAPNEELGREYDELLKLANVVDVRVTHESIVVVTKTLFCVNPKTKNKHEIGAFEIHIFPGRNMIKWFNKTRRVSGGKAEMNAPHVDENGNACFGNTKELFPMLISKREFASAVELAIAFVESVNLDDQWGKFIVNWPIASEPEAKKEEGR